jgi:hypothetical integral membrane protein (TIGR02206 family)
MMEYFFTAQEKMPAGLGFELYGKTHMAWLCAIAAFGVVMCLVYRRMGEKARRRTGIIMALTMVALEILKDAVLVYTGQFQLNYLPLDLCGIAIFGEAACAIWPGEIKKELGYCLFLPGAVMALIFPNWTPMPVMNFFHLHSFVLHGLLTVYPIMLIAGGDHRPNIRNLPKCFCIGLAMCVPIYIFDRVFDENFFFLNTPSPNSPLSLFETWLGSPGYLICFPVMAAALWFFMYLPFCGRGKK